MDVAANVLVIPRTRLRPTTTNDNVMMASAVDTEGTGGNEESIKESSPNKRPRIVDNLEIAEASCTTRSYWPCSPEAYQVFRPKKQGASNDAFDSETPMKALQRRILLL